MIMQLDWKDNAVDNMSYIEIVESILLPDLENSEYRYNIKGFTEGSKEELVKSEIPLNATECMVIFKDRYNDNKIRPKAFYPEFISDKNIQNIINPFNLNPDKFWLLVLFVYDYCDTTFYNGTTMNMSPIEQLTELCEVITKSEDMPMTLTLKTGKQKIVVDNPITIKALTEIISNYKSEIDEDYFTSLHKREKNKETIMLKESPFIAFFAKILLRFLTTQPSIKDLRRKGAKYSKKEMELISNLIHLLRISTNESWLDIENETLKGYLNQYKNYKYPNNISSIYPFLLI